MFLFLPIQFLKFLVKSQPQRSYKKGAYRKKECIRLLIKNLSEIDYIKPKGLPFSIVDTAYLSPSVFRQAKKIRRIEIHQPVARVFGMFDMTQAPVCDWLWLAHFKKHKEEFVTDRLN